MITDFSKQIYLKNFLELSLLKLLLVCFGEGVLEVVLPDVEMNSPCKRYA